MEYYRCTSRPLFPHSHLTLHCIYQPCEMKIKIIDEKNIEIYRSKESSHMFGTNLLSTSRGEISTILEILIRKERKKFPHLSQDNYTVPKYFFI